MNSQKSFEVCGASPGNILLLDKLFGLSEIEVDGRKFFKPVYGAGDNLALALYERGMSIMSIIAKPPDIRRVDFQASKTDHEMAHLKMSVWIGSSVGVPDRVYEICLYAASSDNFQNILGVIRIQEIQGIQKMGQRLELTRDLFDRLLVDISQAIRVNELLTDESLMRAAAFNNSQY